MIGIGILRRSQGRSFYTPIVYLFNLIFGIILLFCVLDQARDISRLGALSPIFDLQ
jgi:hypothetical protein